MIACNGTYHCDHEGERMGGISAAKSVRLACLGGTTTRILGGNCAQGVDARLSKIRGEMAVVLNLEGSWLLLLTRGNRCFTQRRKTHMR